MPAGKGSGDYRGIEVLWDDLIVVSFFSFYENNSTPIREKIPLDRCAFLCVFARSCEKLFYSWLAVLTSLENNYILILRGQADEFRKSVL